MNVRVPVAAELLRSAADSASLDWQKLATYLCAFDLELDLNWEPRQFAGGYGNLNFLLRINGAWAVLRRPPFGPIPKGANDMEREHRVLATLAPVWSLVPRPIHFGEDTAVIDAPFLISEFREGLPLHGPRPLGDRMTPEKAATLSRLQLDVLAQLHSLDVEAVGATGLGRLGGFAARTLRGWTARLGENAPSPAVALFEWLNEAASRDDRISIIHNDFKLDNLLVDAETLSPRAVLDWDMATLGSPFFDLATLLTYWIAPTDPAVLHAINHTHSLEPGALSRRELVEYYFTRMKFGSAEDERELRFFLALAFAKLGVVYIQLYRRFLADPSNNTRYEKFEAAISSVFELGLQASTNELL